MPVTAAAAPTRTQQKLAFLQSIGWADANIALLAGDASFRTYDRLHRNNTPAVLMNAPPPEEDVRPFVRIGQWLVQHGFSAPRIHAADEANGFLLLEDLGDASFSRVLREDATQEQALYLAATDALIALHRTPTDMATAPAYDWEIYAREVGLLTDWYLRAVAGPQAADAARADWLDAWQQVLAALPALPSVLVLRDYHADNLMWLPERNGHQRVGLLDFQDALIGSPGYDLVSFLEDARRDVSPAVREACLQHYCAQTGTDANALRAHYAVLGAQRNSKIVGIFMRLTLRDAKPHYLSYLPRVWALLEQDVQHPALAPIAEWLNTHIPPALRQTPPLETLTQRFGA